MKDPFNILVQQTIEHGFREHFKKESHRILKILNRPNNEPQLDLLLAGVTFNDLKFVFLIYFIGNIAGILCFFIEAKSVYKKMIFWK